MQVSIYMAIVLCAGSFMAGLFIMYIKQTKLQKQLRSIDGFLESEKLKKDTLQKELKSVYQNKETIELTLKHRLQEAAMLNKQMDQDILLLQKSNEETEHLLKINQPEIHALKLQLLEANNTIARLKAAKGK